MKSDHREPTKFVGMYFIDEHGEDYRTGQIIAQISDGYYLAQFDCTDDNVPASPVGSAIRRRLQQSLRQLWFTPLAIFPRC
jgi:hypothetical protein